MKLIALLIVIALGGWWVWTTQPQLLNNLDSYLPAREMFTLEARITPAEIMQARRQELLGTSSRKFKEPILAYVPYLLLDVKYSLADKKTKEATILWDLNDGEMVLSSLNFEKTRGFADCIHARADKNDFKILNILAKNNGILNRETLLQELRVETDLADSWLESVRTKRLVIQKGQDYILHLENSKLNVPPTSNIAHPLVTKELGQAPLISKRFSASQVTAIAQAAFGADFTIRSSKEIVIPIYILEILNPDGSTLPTYWNALTGQRIAGLLRS